MATGIGILGASGRMGRAIANEAAAADVAIAGGIDGQGAVHADHADAAALAKASDVLVDFSTPAALAGHLDAARAARVPILVGTTGLGEADRAAIDDAARDVAVIQAANTSLGINLLRYLVREAASKLGTDWDIDILEMHHRGKLDAPSGTALLLAQEAAEGRGSTLRDLARFDRIGGRNHVREEGSVGFASLRGGSVPGDHMVVFAGEGERIELGHRADSRRIFARGAIHAALWLSGKPPGRYTMGDVLGLV